MNQKAQSPHLWTIAKQSFNAQENLKELISTYCWAQCWERSNSTPSPFSPTVPNLRRSQPPSPQPGWSELAQRTFRQSRVNPA